LVPRQKAPFEITVGTDKVMGGDLSIIDHYAVQVSGQQYDLPVRYYKIPIDYQLRCYKLV